MDFVVVGGIAATLYGSPHDTFDLDVCPAQDPGNLDALGRSLVDLGSRLRGVQDDLQLVPDARALRGVELLTLDTRFGPLDIVMRPDGCPPYEQLRRRATRMDVGPAAVLVASVDDLLAMKAVLDRDEDRADVAELKAIKRLRRRLAAPE